MTAKIGEIIFEYDGTKKYLNIDVKNPNDEATVIYYSYDGVT